MQQKSIYSSSFPSNQYAIFLGQPTMHFYKYVSKWGFPQSMHIKKNRYNKANKWPLMSTPISKWTQKSSRNGVERSRMRKYKRMPKSYLDQTDKLLLCFFFSFSLRLLTGAHSSCLKFSSKPLFNLFCPFLSLFAPPLFLSSSASHYPLHYSLFREDVITVNHHHGESCSLPHVHAACSWQKGVPHSFKMLPALPRCEKKYRVQEGSTILYTFNTHNYYFILYTITFIYIYILYTLKYPFKQIKEYFSFISTFIYIFIFSSQYLTRIFSTI